MASWRLIFFAGEGTLEIIAPLGHLPQKVTTRDYNLNVPYMAEKLKTCNIP
jgi:hypothetical protein